MDRGNLYIQLVKVLYCKLPTIGEQLPTFPHKVQGLSRRPQRWEASVLPLRHSVPHVLNIKGQVLTAPEFDQNDRFSVARWSAGLASNHRLSPLCGASPTSDNAENLSQYDPDC